MTKTQPTNHNLALDQHKTAVENRFNEIAQHIQRILGSEPLSTYSKLRWVTTPFDLTGPRFGAEEHCINDQAVLDISEDLLVKHNQYLEAVLWREAYLLHLPSSVRAVDRVADLGLYCYYRYGLKTRKQRKRFLRIWEATSPPIQYAFYRYFPTGGFSYFDNIVDGNFLKIVKQWFLPFTQLSTSLTEGAYTSNLERWMMNHHRVLKPVELKILKELYNNPTASQIELTKTLGFKQPTISRTIKVLAEKHFLRLSTIENFPVLGLQPLMVEFTSENKNTLNKLMTLASRIRYTLAIHEFQHLVTIVFVIPFRRTERFRQWVKQISGVLDVSSTKIHQFVEWSVSRNFGLYHSHGVGWPLDYSGILGNIQRLIEEGWSQQLPPIRSFRFSAVKLGQYIELRPEDFIFMQRASDAFMVTSRAKFYEAEEARKAGSSDLTYRRRVAYLQKRKVISPPLAIGLLHVGLDGLVSLRIKGSLVEAYKILGSLQLFPHVSGTIFDDGSLDVVLLLPKETTVSVESTLTAILQDYGNEICSAIKPAWEAYGWVFSPPVIPENYDFTNNSWIWVKDTLPHISTERRA